MIFISHKLEEVERLADRVTVMRRGQVVGERRAGAFDAAELGRWMLGRDLPPMARPAAGRGDAEVLLRIEGLSTRPSEGATTLCEVDLEVRTGEIVGIAGIDGNGQRELEEAIAGVRPISSGGLSVAGKPVAPGARTLRAERISHLSGERERAGLISGFDLTENWVLKSSHEGAPYFPGGWIDPRAAHAAVEAAIAQYAIAPGDPDADIATLSGGNAQKLAVAREFATEPRVLIAVNPTRGLDVGSARFVQEQLLALRARGGGVLLISTELDEVLALADNVVVIERGRLHPVSPGADRAEIGAVMLGRSRT